MTDADMLPSAAAFAACNQLVLADLLCADIQSCDHTCPESCLHILIYHPTGVYNPALWQTCPSQRSPQAHVQVTSARMSRQEGRQVYT